MASTGNKMYHDFDISKVVYKDPVKNSRGGLNGYLDTSAEDRSNPRFQFPKCRTPFGISDRKSDNEFARLNLELSCDDERMLEFIKAFDAQNINIASKNSPDWFKKQLSELMTTLNATEPHFVRCMKPNKAKVGGVYEAEMMLAQLRYSGLLEVCRIRKLGFPLRRDFDEFYKRYRCIAPGAG